MAKLRTKIFRIKGIDPKEIADAIGFDLSAVYRIKEGERGVSGNFVAGVLAAYPMFRFEDLFYIDNGKKVGKPETLKKGGETE
jgi:hypothetical protein